MKLRVWPILLLAIVGPAGAAARGPDQKPADRAAHIRAHYTKYEYRIPMRDGVRLFTTVWVPNDLEASPSPLLMLRTPYGVGPYGADRYPESLGPHAGFEREKFIFVRQDVRGRFMSEGQFVNMRPHLENKRNPKDVDESSDTYDTIEWLLRNVDGHNGKVGLWGVSYPGFYASAGAIDSHPALRAVSPQAPIADWFWDDMHHHGAFILPLAFNFFAAFGQPRPEPTTERAESFDHGDADGYQFFLDLGPLSNANERYFKGEIAFWNEITRHPNYDRFWQARNILPHLKEIEAAVMVVGGWYDMEDLYGPLNTYRAIERQNPGTVNTIVMGPWRHGDWRQGDGESLGAVEFGFKTAEWYRERVDLPFFRHHLQGGEDPGLPEALMFETGANRWREFDAWPPRELEPRRLYLRAGGRLAFEPPTARNEETACDRYISDPAKPVPYTMDITTAWNATYMTEDQRFAAWRPDVLVYKTEVLEDDLTLAGPLVADLWVSTTGGDSDWVVKLIDVFPPEHPEAERRPEKTPLGHRQSLVRGEVFRGRFRNSYERAEPFEPGEVTRVRFELQDVLHTFKRGHRVMVQVHSTWFPLVDRNPQSWVANIFEAREEDFVAVENSVFRTKAYPSALEVGVLP